MWRRMTEYARHAPLYGAYNPNTPHIVNSQIIHQGRQLLCNHAKSAEQIQSVWNKLTTLNHSQLTQGVKARWAQIRENARKADLRSYPKTKWLLGGAATALTTYTVWASDKSYDHRKTLNAELDIINAEFALPKDPLKFLSFPFLNELIKIEPKELTETISQLEQFSKKLVSLTEEKLPYVPAYFTKQFLQLDNADLCLKKIAFFLTVAKSIQLYQEHKISDAISLAESQLPVAEKIGIKKSALENLIGALHFKQASEAQEPKKRIQHFEKSTEYFLHALDLDSMEDEEKLKHRLLNLDKGQRSVVCNLMQALMDALQVQLDSLYNKEKPVLSPSNKRIIEDAKKIQQQLSKLRFFLRGQTFDVEVLKVLARLMSKECLLYTNRIIGNEADLEQCLEDSEETARQYQLKDPSNPLAANYTALSHYYSGCHKPKLDDKARLTYKTTALEILRKSIADAPNYKPNLDLFARIVINVCERSSWFSSNPTLLAEARKHAQRGLDLAKIDNHANDQKNFELQLKKINSL